MLTLSVEVPYASFRKSYARSFAETYPLPPPSTVYGMLLSLVGERFRQRHQGVRMAFAYRCRCDEERRCGLPCLPHVATTLRKLSRYKYGVASKQSALGNAPDFVETLCDIEFLCNVDSSLEKQIDDGKTVSKTLEARIIEAIQEPTYVQRFGVLSLGLSDDAVNSVNVYTHAKGLWHRLLPKDWGGIELPIWVDHVGGANTRWQRYELEVNSSELNCEAGDGEWGWTEMIDPRGS